MKKKYIAPELEIETYALNTAIAANCSIVVSNGPADEYHEQCSDYKDPFAGDFNFGISTAAVYNVQFYEYNCDCYYSSGDGYWQS